MQMGTLPYPAVFLYVVIFAMALPKSYVAAVKALGRAVGIVAHHGLLRNGLRGNQQCNEY